jgi:nicotinamidase-related amidase
MPEHDRARVIASCELLLEAARLFNLQTIVTEQYPKGLGPTTQAITAKLDAFETRPAVIEKTIFSAAVPEVLAKIQLPKRPRVIVVGMETHVCVLQTVRDLLALGFTVHVPFDAVCSREPAAKRTALEAFARFGAVVTSSESVVFDLLGDAKHPHFKALSARVKDLPLAK